MEEEVGYVRVVIVPGTFDLVHAGHEELITIAFDISDNVLVLVNNDEMIRQRKGIKLAMNQEERVERIKKYYPNASVEIVQSIEEIQLIMRSIATFHGGVLVLHGDDYNIHSLSALYNVETKWWRVNGITPLFCHRSTGVSSTKLREAQGKHL